MTDNHIQLSMLIVQTGALAGLVWYCIETAKMRKAAQDQVKVSQDLISAGMNQVEGLAKPCLTFATGPRNIQDAMVGLGVVGSTSARSDGGFFAVENIGNGAAINVNYQFVAVGESARFARHYDVRYVQNVLAGKMERMIEPLGSYNGEYEVTFHYDSMGGRRYESKIFMNGQVLTNFKFKEIKPSGD